MPAKPKTKPGGKLMRIPFGNFPIGMVISALLILLANAICGLHPEGLTTSEGLYFQVANFLTWFLWVYAWRYNPGYQSKSLPAN